MRDDTVEPPIQSLLTGRHGLLVRLQARPGVRPVLLDLLNSYIDGLEDEPGTQMFILSVDPDDADIVWLYEIFRDEAAQLEHRSTEGFAALMSGMPDLLAGSPGVLRLDPLRLSLQDSLLRDDLSI